MNIPEEDDRTISIDGDWFRTFLAMKLRELAADRCRRMLDDRIKKKRDVRDKSYVVS